LKDFASRVFVTRSSRAASSGVRGYRAELSTRTPSEVDTGDQFIDAASQSLAQRRFALEPKQVVSFTSDGIIRSDDAAAAVDV
jgi:hypothetical protein